MASCSDDFRNFLLLISQDITTDKLREIKFLCENRVPARTLKEISRAEDLFSVLERSGLLTEFNTKLLENLLENVGLVRLKEKLEIFQETRSSTGLPTSNGSPYFIANLPCEVKHFLGRDDIVDEMISVVRQRSTRITAVIAPPGFGKSAIATHAGHMIYENRYASVLYVSLRQRQSLAEVCSDIIRCCRKGSLLSTSDDPVMQVQNILASLECNMVLILDNAEDIQLSSSGPMFMDFIQFLGNHAENVHVILTTRQDVQIRQLDVHRIQLLALEPVFSSSLLSKLVHTHHTTWALQLGKLCGGVPLFLHLAASLLNNGFDPKVLVGVLRSSGPVKVLQMPNPDLEGFYFSLLLFFKRINKGFLKSLVRVSAFPTSFTAADACFLFEDQTTCEFALSCLVGCALLQHTSVGRIYEMHPLVQSFCRTEKGKLGLEEEGQKAEKAFIEHNLQHLQNIHRKFVSENGSQNAMESFRQKQDNIMWALKKSLSEASKMKSKAVDVCTKVVNFLGKALRPSEFNELYERCLVVSTDEVRRSDCLISLGFRHLLDVDNRTHSTEAHEFFQEALEIRESASPSQQLFQCEEYAHGISKLGVCRVLSGDMTGRELVLKALKIRIKRGDVLMEAAGYSDLALTYHIEGDHVKAINLWQNRTLKQFKKRLGNHPWIATALSDIADAYQTLDNLDSTIRYKKQALAMREKLLGKGHLDTTRSRFQLAKIYKDQERLHDALEGFESTLELQEKHLGVHHDTVKTMSAMAELMGKLNQAEDAERMTQRAATYRDKLKKRRKRQRKISTDTVEQCYTRRSVCTPLGVLIVCCLFALYYFFVSVSPRAPFNETITEGEL